MERKRIAITGGIGSGKSAVLKIIAENGIKTISSDQIVKELYGKPEIKRLLLSVFPEAIKGKERLKIDREELARQAFSSPEKHKKLTELITPIVMDEIDRRTKRDKGLVFVEVPLLFECQYQNRFDGVWVIYRGLDDRINSVIARSNLTKKQVIERIHKQVDYDKLDLSKYTVIENSGNLNQLNEKVCENIKKMSKIY